MPVTPRRTAPIPASDNGEAAPSTGGGFHWSLLGAVLASICCVGPLVAILLGVGGAASTLGLVRFKLEFIAVGLVVTLAGIVLALRRSKASCSVAAYRRNRILIPAVSLLTFSILVVGSNVLLLNDRVIDAASARLSRALERDAPIDRAGSFSDPAAAPVARQLDVAITSGVSCPACLLAIQERIAGLPGVQRVSVGEDGAGYAAIVVYDPSKVDQSRIVAAIANAPGALGGAYGTDVLRDEPAVS